MKKLMAAVLVSMIAVGAPPPAFAYLKYGVRVGANTVDVRWTQSPIRYFVTDRGTAQVAGTGACWCRDARLCDVAERLNVDGSQPNSRGRRSSRRDFRMAGPRLASWTGPTWTVCLAKPVFCSMPARAKSSKPTSSSTPASHGRRPPAGKQVVSTSNPSPCTRSAISWASATPRLGETEMLAGGGRRLVGLGRCDVSDFDVARRRR